MNENKPNLFNQLKIKKEQLRITQLKEYIAIALELSKSPEYFPFMGIEPEAYNGIHQGDLDYPGFDTPIDEKIKKFTEHGIKVALSTSDPESGNIFILPAYSDNINEDNISPRHLMITEGMDENLKKLIRIDIERNKGH